MNADKAAWQRKRIDRAIAYQKGLPGKTIPGFVADIAQLLGRLHQRRPDGLQIFFQQWVFEVVRV